MTGLIELLSLLHPLRGWRGGVGCFSGGRRKRDISAAERQQKAAALYMSKCKCYWMLVLLLIFNCISGTLSTTDINGK